MDFIGWGSILWLIGYILGIVAFFFVAPDIIGWVISPLMLFTTAWILWKRVDVYDLTTSILLGLTWTGIAVVLDYFLLVKLFNPPDGYYKLDVYLYYGWTFLLPPLISGLRRRQR